MAVLGLVATHDGGRGHGHLNGMRADDIKEGDGVVILGELGSSEVFVHHQDGCIQRVDLSERERMMIGLKQLNDGRVGETRPLGGAE